MFLLLSSLWPLLAVLLLLHTTGLDCSCFPSSSSPGSSHSLLSYSSNGVALLLAWTFLTTLQTRLLVMDPFLLHIDNLSLMALPPVAESTSQNSSEILIIGYPGAVPQHEANCLDWDVSLISVPHLK
ncbi:hypothetical protein EV401DRAFT_1890071 [Pisolithus croceorrhizus]|nr:hypothetical protein EV401DRAFT_1890071 [Pisolithus croceorrhizus]